MLHTYLKTWIKKKLAINSIYIYVYFVIYWFHKNKVIKNMTF